MIDLEKRLVTVRGEAIQLTPHEFGLMRLFATNVGKLLTHRDDTHRGLGPRLPDGVPLSPRVRLPAPRKIEPDPTRPRYLLTEPGVGVPVRRAGRKDLNTAEGASPRPPVDRWL